MASSSCQVTYYMIIVIIALGYSPYMVMYYMIIVIIALGYSPYMVMYHMIIGKYNVDIPVRACY